MHGTGSRFLSIQQLKGDELMPRIIPIAGVYPGITVQEFMEEEEEEEGEEEGRRKHNFEGGRRVCLSVFVVDKSDWEKQESGRERQQQGADGKEAKAGECG